MDDLTNVNWMFARVRARVCVCLWVCGACVVWCVYMCGFYTPLCVLWCMRARAYVCVENACMLAHKIIALIVFNTHHYFAF